MLQRLIHIKLNTKISCKNINLLFRVPFQSQPCLCGVRLYTSGKIATFRNYERPAYKNGIFCMKPRYYTSQVDAQKKDLGKTVKSNTPLETSKKINAKLKPTELRRLFSLAAPEKWTLTGMLCVLILD